MEDMPMPAKISEHLDVSLSDRFQAINQVADLIKQVTKLEITHHGGTGFSSKTADETHLGGIQSVEGTLEDDAVLKVKLEILIADQDVRVSARKLLSNLALLGERSRLVAPQDDGDNRSVWVEIPVQASPLSLTRSTALLNELRKIDQLASSIQASSPDSQINRDLSRLYQGVSDIIEPVCSWRTDMEISPRFSRCISDMLDLVTSSYSILLLAESSIELDYTIARLARSLEGCGSSLGRAIYPGLSLRAIVEFVRRAPGKVVIPLTSLRFGASPFEIEYGFATLLRMLAARRESAVFIGLSSIDEDLLKLTRSPGKDSHPLVSCEIPSIPIEELTYFAVTLISNAKGGLLKKEIEILAECIIRAVDLIDPADSVGILPNLIVKKVDELMQGKKVGFDSICSEIFRIHNLKGGKRDKLS